MTTILNRIITGSCFSLRALLTGAVAAWVCGAAAGQTSIDPANKFAWAENVGWLNWRDAGEPEGTQGVQVRDTFLSGFVWAENVGWINLGDGTPANGVAYANATGADFGVNRDLSTAELFGLAWGENIGWINFAGGAMASPANPARIESDRLRGFVWGENIGWISLDDATHFVGLSDSCNLAGDLDQDGDVDLSDLATLLSNFGAIGGVDPADGDIDDDDDVDLSDLAALLANFGSSCP